MLVPHSQLWRKYVREANQATLRAAEEGGACLELGEANDLVCGRRVIPRFLRGSFLGDRWGLLDVDRLWEQSNLPRQNIVQSWHQQEEH